MASPGGSFSRLRKDGKIPGDQDNNEGERNYGSISIARSTSPILKRIKGVDECQDRENKRDDKDTCSGIEEWEGEIERELKGGKYVSKHEEHREDNDQGCIGIQEIDNTCEEAGRYDRQNT